MLATIIISVLLVIIDALVLRDIVKDDTDEVVVSMHDL